MKVDGRHVRSIWLESDGWSVSAIDQRRLPHDFVVARLTTCDAAADAIGSMLVRGAPLIGATAAYGVALAMRSDSSDAALEAAYKALIATRPTAINLKWALDEMRSLLRPLPLPDRVRGGLCARRRDCRGRHRHQQGHRPTWPCPDRGDPGHQEAGRSRQRTDPLQRRLAGNGRLGHGNRADLSGA